MSLTHGQSREGEIKGNDRQHHTVMLRNAEAKAYEIMSLDREKSYTEKEINLQYNNLIKEYRIQLNTSKESFAGFTKMTAELRNAAALIKTTEVRKKECLNSEVGGRTSSSTEVEEKFNSCTELGEKSSSSTEVGEESSSSIEAGKKSSSSADVREKSSSSTDVGEVSSLGTEAGEKLSSSTEVGEESSSSIETGAKSSSSADVREKSSSSTDVGEKSSSSGDVREKSSSSTEVGEESSSSTEAGEKLSSSTEVGQESSSSTEAGEKLSSSTEVGEKSSSSTELGETGSSTGAGGETSWSTKNRKRSCEFDDDRQVKNLRRDDLEETNSNDTTNSSVNLNHTIEVTVILPSDTIKEFSTKVLKVTGVLHREIKRQLTHVRLIKIMKEETGMEFSANLVQEMKQPIKNYSGQQVDKISEELIQNFQFPEHNIPVENQGGGDSLYRAISQSIYATEENHAIVRLAILNQLLMKQQRYEKFDTSDKYKNTIESVAELGKWKKTGALTAYVVSELMERPIWTVGTSFQHPILYSDQHKDSQALFLHYRSLSGKVSDIMDHFVPLLPNDQIINSQIQEPPVSGDLTTRSPGEVELSVYPSIASDESGDIDATLTIDNIEGDSVSEAGSRSNFIIPATPTNNSTNRSEDMDISVEVDKTNSSIFYSNDDLSIYEAEMLEMAKRIDDRRRQFDLLELEAGSKKLCAKEGEQASEVRLSSGNDISSKEFPRTVHFTINPEKLRMEFIGLNKEIGTRAPAPRSQAQNLNIQNQVPLTQRTIISARKSLPTDSEIADQILLDATRQFYKSMRDSLKTRSSPVRSEVIQIILEEDQKFINTLRGIAVPPRPNNDHNNDRLSAVGIPSTAFRKTAEVKIAALEGSQHEPSSDRPSAEAVPSTSLFTQNKVHMAVLQALQRKLSNGRLSTTAIPPTPRFTNITEQLSVPQIPQHGPRNRFSAVSIPVISRFSEQGNEVNTAVPYGQQHEPSNDRLSEVGTSISASFSDAVEEISWDAASLGGGSGATVNHSEPKRHFLEPKPLSPLINEQNITANDRVKSWVNNSTVVPPLLEYAWKTVTLESILKATDETLSVGTDRELLRSGNKRAITPADILNRTMSENTIDISLVPFKHQNYESYDKYNKILQLYLKTPVYACALCGLYKEKIDGREHYSFPVNRQNLKRHGLRVHTANTFQCPIPNCGTIKQTQKQIDDHMIHQLSAPNKCHQIAIEKENNPNLKVPKNRKIVSKQIRTDSPLI